MGYRVWIDLNQLQSGHTWRNEIAKGVMNAKCFLFVMSPRSAGSQYCSEEITLAYDEKKPIGVLVLEEAPEQLQENPGLKMLIGNTVVRKFDYAGTDDKQTVMKEVADWCNSHVTSKSSATSSAACVIS